MNRQQTLANAVLESRTLIARYFRGFDDSNHTKQAPHLPNHFAWTLGHLAITIHRASEKFDGKPIPDTDFTTGDGRAGGPTRFDTGRTARRPPTRKCTTSTGSSRPLRPRRGCVHSGPTSGA